MAEWEESQLDLHSVPGLGSAQLRTTNASPRGQTRRSVSIGEKMYTSLRCKPVELSRDIAQFEIK